MEFVSEVKDGLPVFDSHGASGGFVPGVTDPSIPTIAIVNRSPDQVPDSQIPDVVEAIAFQVQRHFHPWWGQSSNVIFVPSTEKPPAGSWQVTLLPDPDVANALGYHDKTRQGLPLGKVFTKLSGSGWAITTSHEVLEMLGDPSIIKAVSLQFSDTDRDYMYEACDPVQGYSYWIRITSGAYVLVSDFVTQQWFDPSLAGIPGVRFDFLRVLTKPLEVAPMGYCIYRDFRSGGWQQVFGEQIEQMPAVRMAALPRIGSRRERRQRGQGRLVWSTAD